MSVTAVVPRQLSGSSVITQLPSNYSSIPPAGATVTRANSIRLPSGSSSVNNYYVGFDVILTKTLANGKSYVQKKRIAAYDGSSRVAVIEDIWDIGYEPQHGDKYQLVLAYPDARVSINPPMQVLDYVTSDRYGRNLNPVVDCKLSTWMSSARKCDAQSDVSLKLTSVQTLSKDAVYRLVDGSRLVWEGKVRQDVTGRYVNFTSVLGKITNKWNSWKTYEAGDIVYSGDRFYRANASGAFTTDPTHTGTQGNLTRITSLTIAKVSGTGPANLTLDISSNPVLALNAKGEEISGYSLYDSDSVDYWRRLGWDEHSQSYATLYQTNFTIDTSVPMFDNINMMLEHFNGIFSYSAGKYALDIEEMAETWIEITQDDIIGKIGLEDTGSRTAFNSVTVSYSDPGNNFEARNISLFSQEYLKQDRNVPKKGNISVSGITNYYNVRLLADSYLKRSRFNSTITLTLFPEFITLEVGNVIGVSYKRYNWWNKPFRIESLTINPDGTISIVGTEYHESFYALTNMNKTAEVGNRTGPVYTAIPAPSNLKATNTTNNNEIKDGIMLTWTNTPGLQEATTIEIYSSDTSSPVLTATSIGSNTINFSAPHGLKVGSAITATKSGNGFVAGRSYFVKTVASSTSVQVSEELNGDLKSLTNGVSLSITFNPFKLVGSVSYPENTYLHTFPNITANTVKYYKCRYKTTK